MAEIAIERVDALKTADLHDLCDAADDAIKAGGGFGWVAPPPRDVMVAGSAQLVKPARNNEAQAHAATLTTNFVAPWARGHGLARRLTQAVEDEARAAGFRILNLDVRETQDAAIRLYEDLGFKRWGTHPCYALVDGKQLAGHFYAKDLSPDTLPDTP